MTRSPLSALPSLSDVTPFGPVNVGTTERIVTAGLGGALLTLGLDRGQGGGGIMALVGGIMLTRAITGHCPAYRSLGIGGTDDHGDSRPRMGGMDRDTASLRRSMQRESGRWPEDGRRQGHDPRSADMAEVLAGPQPHARSGASGRSSPPSDDRVEEASELSFPASDPPAYTSGRST